MNPLVSIIIPVYNAEKYILHCLNSVENQSYNNLEIVVVNDGSTDGSDELCKSYAEAHRNVTVLNQKNLGLSAARNSGIRYAQGEYLFFWMQMTCFIPVQLGPWSIMRLITETL